MSTGVEGDERLVEPLPAMDETSQSPAELIQKCTHNGLISGEDCKSPGESMDESSRQPPAELIELTHQNGLISGVLEEPAESMDETSQQPPTEPIDFSATSLQNGLVSGGLAVPVESMDETSRPTDFNELQSPSTHTGLDEARKRVDFKDVTSQHSPTDSIEYRPSTSHLGLMLGVRVEGDSEEQKAGTIRSPVSHQADEIAPVDQCNEHSQPSPHDGTKSPLPAATTGETSESRPASSTVLPVESPPYRPRSPHYRREESEGEETDDLEGLDAEVVIEIIDRLGSSEDEDEVEYLLQCVNNRQQWVKRKEWIARYPQCAPMSDIYELCRNNQRRKRQMKKDTRSRAETRIEDALSPSSSDEEDQDVFGSPNRLNKRRKRREARREAQRKDAAIREAWNGTNNVDGRLLQEAADLDFPTSSMDLNPRSPPKRPSGGDILNWPGLAKVVRVDELAEKREKILASFVPGNGKDFYTKGKYDCSFDMISFAKVIDRNAQERIFNHKIESILGCPPNYPDFLVIILTRTNDITNEMVEAIFPDMTLAISRECLTIHAPLALKQYEAAEKLKKH